MFDPNAKTIFDQLRENELFRVDAVSCYVKEEYAPGTNQPNSPIEPMFLEPQEEQLLMRQMNAAKTPTHTWTSASARPHKSSTSATEDNANKAAEGTRETKVVQFVPEKTQASKKFAFEKVEYASTPPPATGPSILSTLLQHEVRGRTLNLKVFFHGCGPTPVKISVPEDATVEAVIKAALRQYISENRKPALSENPKAYVLRLAEADGTPDEDIPELNRDAAIGKINENSTFALVKNPRFTTISYTDRGSLPARPRRQSGADMDLIRVYLPGDQHMVVPVQPELSVYTVLLTVCKKRQINHELFQFTKANGEPINHNDKISALDTREFKVVPKEYKEAGPPTAEPGPGERIIFFTPVTASQLTTYRVIKINQRGARQVRIMGIDRDRITNMYPEDTNDAKKSKRGNTKKTSVPMRYIRDVVRTIYDPKTPTKFSIQFKDRTLNYEAQSEAEVVEIITKINYLLQLENSGA